MNTFNRKNISVALLITLGAIFSSNASAAQSNTIEDSISEMVVAQGQQVMTELSTQIQSSIAEELKSFSIDLTFDESISESLAWITDEQAIAEEPKPTTQASVNLKNKSL